MSRIEEVRARCEAATPGPWFEKDGYVDYAKNSAIAAVGVTDQDIVNAAFIANARTDIPALLDVIEWLSSALDRTEKERDGAVNGYVRMLRERDAAVKDLSEIGKCCGACANYCNDDNSTQDCEHCVRGGLAGRRTVDCWQWRGPQEGERAA